MINVEAVLIIALLVYMGVREHIWLKKEQMYLGLLLGFKQPEPKEDTTEPIPPELYISDEKIEETMKETMGDVAYKQFVSDQQYGKVG